MKRSSPSCKREKIGDCTGSRIYPVRSKSMKRFGFLGLLFSLSLALVASCPASLSEEGPSYDLSDNSGDASHTNEAITGQVHDNMGYNQITTTGTGNSQNATNGGTTVQNYFGNTTKEQVSAAP